MDFHKVAQENVGGESLQQLHEAADEAAQLEQLVEDLEQSLKDAKKALNRVKGTVMPDLMTEVGFQSFTHNGVKFELADFVSGSLPSDPEKKAAAIDWLTANEGADLLKSQVVASFGRSQHNVAAAVADELKGKFGSDGIELKESVHPQTLQKFVRERLASGDPVDLDVLGVYVGRVVKLRRA